jgi:hypothetical protein
MDSFPALDRLMPAGRFVSIFFITPTLFTDLGKLSPALDLLLFPDRSRLKDDMVPLMGRDVFSFSLNTAAFSL